MIQGTLNYPRKMLLVVDNTEVQDFQKKWQDAQALHFDLWTATNRLVFLFLPDHKYCTEFPCQRAIKDQCQARKFNLKKLPNQDIITLIALSREKSTWLIKAKCLTTLIIHTGNSSTHYGNHRSVLFNAKYQGSYIC